MRLAVQVMALSATFSETTMESLLPMMKKPQRINLCEDTVSLVGIRQLYSLVHMLHDEVVTSSDQMEHKGREVLGLLRRLAFNQVRCSVLHTEHSVNVVTITRYILTQSGCVCTAAQTPGFRPGTLQRVACLQHGTP
jgi:hypothetical protein